MILTGGAYAMRNSRPLVSPTIGHEADASEAQDHHGPGGGLGNGSCNFLKPYLPYVLNPVPSIERHENRGDSFSGNSLKRKAVLAVCQNPAIYQRRAGKGELFAVIIEKLEAELKGCPPPFEPFRTVFILNSKSLKLLPRYKVPV